MPDEKIIRAVLWDRLPSGNLVRMASFLAPDRSHISVPVSAYDKDYLRIPDLNAHPKDLNYWRWDYGERTPIVKHYSNKYRTWDSWDDILEVWYFRNVGEPPSAGLVPALSSLPDTCMKKQTKKSPPEIFTIPERAEKNCCALFAIALFTGATYPEVVRRVAQCYPSLDPNKGLNNRQMLRILRSLGLQVRRVLVDDMTPLELETLPDGPLLLRYREHVAYVRQGLQFEPDHSVWPVEAWLAAHPTERVVELWLPLSQT
jgi:hypothetical protein